MSANTPKKERGLFQIFAIDKASDMVVFEEMVVSEGESEALFDSSLKENLQSAKRTKDDVHIIVVEISPIPPKETIKKVKVLGGIGNTALVREEKE